MKYFKLIVLISVISLNGFSQDEFIDKYSNEITDFDLKIISVTKDSLFYKSFRKNKSIPLSDLYCYRYKNGYWIKPDTSIKGIVMNGKFHEYEPPTPYYKKPDYILKDYYIGTDANVYESKNDYKIIFTQDSTKARVLRKNRSINFSLSEDSLNALFNLDLYKIVEDHLIVTGRFIGNKNISFWKIPMKDIEYIDFQTSGQKALKITSSILFSTLLITTNAIGGHFTTGTLPGIKLTKKYDMNSSVQYQFIKIEDKSTDTE